MNRKNWIETTLDAIAEINPSLDKSDLSDDLLVSFVPMPSVQAKTGKINLTETRKLVEVKKGFTSFQKNDVLFAKITPCMENGKMAIVPSLLNNVGFGSTEFHVLRPRPGINPAFIYYFISSDKFRSDAEHNMTGAVGQRRVPTQYLKNHPISIPPLSEQCRIVAKIEELFAEIDEGTERLLKAKELLKGYRQSLLKSAFEGKLTEEWRNKHIKNTYPKTLTDKQISGDISPELPEGWDYIPLGNLIEEPKYGTSKKCTYDAEGIGVLRIPNILDGTVDTTDLKFAQFDDAERAAYNLISGDILIIRSNGSIAIVGKSALITENAEQYLFAGYLIRLRPYKHLISSNFLTTLLSSHFLRTQIENKAKSTSGVNNINSNELKSLLIPLCELEEQKVIVNTLKEYLSTTDSLEKEIQKGLHRLNALRQSVLKKAFAGKLVPQDITDELASTLLARIKAENENQKPLKKKSKQRQKVVV